MTYRKMHPMFDGTFVHFGSVPETIREGLWNYLAYGLPPGGFMEAVILNKFVEACTRADHTWSGRSFHDLAKWLYHHAPSASWGSREKYEAWRMLAYEDRLQIMIDHGLRPHEFQILSGAAVP